MSAIVMAVAGAVCVWSGGYLFGALITVSAGLMVWELRRMIVPENPGAALRDGVVAAMVIALVMLLPALYAAIVAGALVVGAALRIERRKPVFATYLAAILLACAGFIVMRQDFGLLWMLWMILVVVASDVMGYAAGRLIGGPKFWPRVSPKKTWSGTIAGWIGAAVVGYIFSNVLHLFYGLGGQMMLLSVATAIAAQMGDIAESAIKRLCGIKDSSNLIPGHGGVLDRFDGMIGASVLLFALFFGYGQLMWGA
jgi:phosphatidate cytidylyltransferase